MASCMEFSDSDKSEFEGFSGNDVTNTENALTVVPDSLESVQSFDLDTESDTQSVDISENASSSNNEIDNLLEDIDNLSEDENGSEVNTTTHPNTPEPIQDRDTPLIEVNPAMMTWICVLISTTCLIIQEQVMKCSIFYTKIRNGLITLIQYM